MSRHALFVYLTGVRKDQPFSFWILVSSVILLVIVGFALLGFSLNERDFVSYGEEVTSNPAVPRLFDVQGKDNPILTIRENDFIRSVPMKEEVLFYCSSADYVPGQTMYDEHMEYLDVVDKQTALERIEEHKYFVPNYLRESDGSVFLSSVVLFDCTGLR